MYGLVEEMIWGEGGVVNDTMSYRTSDTHPSHATAVTLTEPQRWQHN